MTIPTQWRKAVRDIGRERTRASLVVLAIAIGLAVVVAMVPELSRFWPWVLVIGVIVAFVVEGVRIVPQQSAWVVERLGRFHGILHGVPLRYGNSKLGAHGVTGRLRHGKTPLAGLLLVPKVSR